MAYAISKIVMDHMKGNLEREYWKHARIVSCALTWHEALGLCVPPHHVDLLLQAAEVAATYGSNFWDVEITGTLDETNGPQALITLNDVSGRMRPLAPKRPDWLVGKYVEAAQRVVDKITHELKTQRMYATCLHVLDSLNTICSDGSQIRTLWPAVQFLCTDYSPDRSSPGYRAQASAALAWREKHSQPKIHRNMPRVDPRFRKHLQETSEWLTLASILERQTTETRSEATASLAASSYPFMVYEMDGTPMLMERKRP